VVIGFFYLLKNLGLIDTALWDIFWPTVVVLLGLKMLLVSRKWDQCWKGFVKGKKIKIE
jgi:hypothetical protein